MKLYFEVEVYVIGSQKRGNFVHFQIWGYSLMNLKLAMIILWSFCYTHQEIQAPAISCVGVASVHTTCGRKLAVLYLWFDGYYFWQEAIYSFKHGICEAEGLMCPYTKNKVRGPHCFEMVIAWKCQNLAFCTKLHLFSDLLTYMNFNATCSRVRLMQYDMSHQLTHFSISLA